MLQISYVVNFIYLDEQGTEATKVAEYIKEERNELKKKPLYKDD
jgi:hypothetical protein